MSRNQFIARLLLHHFLGVEDIQWLALYEVYALKENQKRALIFVKEVGAIDNNAYRQLNTVDTLKASQDLRDLKRKEILDQKGKGKATYYIAGENYLSSINIVSGSHSAPVSSLSTPVNSLNTPVDNISTPVRPLNTPPDVILSTPPEHKISTELIAKITNLGTRVNDAEILKNIIKDICNNQFLSQQR
jgi:ATP-dependent DNA helicase RecG